MFDHPFQFSASHVAIAEIVSRDSDSPTVGPHSDSKLVNYDKCIRGNRSDVSIP